MIGRPVFYPTTQALAAARAEHQASQPDADDIAIAHHEGELAKLRAVPSYIRTWEQACDYAFTKATAEGGFTPGSDKHDKAARKTFELLWGLIPDYVEYGLIPDPFFYKKLAHAAWQLGGFSNKVSQREEFVDLLAGKQADYGPKNITTLGHIGLLVRLNDKLARWENLTSKHPDIVAFEKAYESEGWAPFNESLTDTLMDIVGYCTIAIMLEDGTFELPLEAEAS